MSDLSRNLVPAPRRPDPGRPRAPQLVAELGSERRHSAPRAHGAGRPHLLPSTERARLRTDKVCPDETQRKLPGDEAIFTRTPTRALFSEAATFTEHLLCARVVLGTED